MNREKARQILGESATEEQITNLLNEFHNAEKTKNEEITALKNEVGKYSDYSEMKAKLEEIEKANMTREEQIALREKMANENYEKSRIMLNTTKAKEILSGLNLDDETIALMVSSDESKTVANATKLKNQLEIMRENTIKDTRESMANVDLKPSITNVNQSDDVMTFDKFSKLSADEQEKFIAEHPEEFERL